ncbi:MAG: hypothetical protein J7513_09050 [Solirubrobacteraceae bacterium]|nr:hypothetical protein [Solirubrobacteraceae bacterium]
MSQSLTSVHRRVAVFAAALLSASALAASPAAAAPSLGQTQLALDPILKLGATVAGVRITPIAPAQIGSGGLYFPVTKQSASSSFTNTVKHSGGFQFAYGNVKIGFQNPTLTIKGSPAKGTLSAEPIVNGTVIPWQFPISNVTVTSASTKRGQLTGKTKVTIDPNLIALLNQVLGVSLIKPGQSWATTETLLPAPTVAASTTGK